VLISIRFALLSWPFDNAKRKLAHILFLMLWVPQLPLYKVIQANFSGTALAEDSLELFDMRLKAGVSLRSGEVPE